MGSLPGTQALEQIPDWGEPGETLSSSPCPVSPSGIWEGEGLAGSREMPNGCR